MRIILAYTYFGLLFICFVASLVIYFKKRVPLFLRLFPPFIFLTLVVEIAGHLVDKAGLNNAPLYNLFTTLEFIFYFYVLGYVNKSRRVKNFLYVLCWIYPFLVAINLFSVQGNYIFHTYTLVPAALIVILFSTIHIYGLVKQRPPLTLKHQPVFWLCLGLLVFYGLTLPLIAVINFIYKHYPFGQIEKLIYVQLLPNFLLYPLFVVGLFVAPGTSNQTSG